MEFSLNLKKLGWDSFFEEHFMPYAQKGLHPGRVLSGHKTGYMLYTEFGEFYTGISGKMRYEASGRSDFPVVGDWVAIKPRPEEKFAIIHGTLPRKSSFSRKAAGRETEEQLLAANIDTVFWVSSLNRMFNPRRIERFLMLAYESSAVPAIILNKADLCATVEKTVDEVMSVAEGVPVHVTSALKGLGLEALTPYIQNGNTVVFLGVSGVGKSTLLNKLAGTDIQKVDEIREHDDRGRHTTAVRSLFILPQGGCVIDSPGIRELQLWNVPERIYDAFEDIEKIARNCRFKNCNHDSEPFCAVKKAVEDGIIPSKRFANFKKMKKEVDYLETKRNMKTKIDEKRNMKLFSKMIKRYKRTFFQK